MFDLGCCRQVSRRDDPYVVVEVKSTNLGERGLDSLAVAHPGCQHRGTGVACQPGVEHLDRGLSVALSGGAAQDQSQTVDVVAGLFTSPER
jgi:hypothetical protein